MKIILKQTHHTIADFDSILTELKTHLDKSSDPLLSEPQIVIYPELFLTGYPLQDLVLQREFIERYTQFIDELNHFLTSKKPAEYQNQKILVGGLTYEFDQNGLPLYIRNVIFDLKPGYPLEAIYTKCLLPNYDIFDEQKYFSAGSEAKILEFKDLKIGLLICEDMWFSSTHKIDPVGLLNEKVQAEGIDLDLIVNLSASPYFIGKAEKRMNRAQEISHQFGCSFAYVNRVGGEDEILFDGESFVYHPESTQQAKAFCEDTLEFSLQSAPKFKRKESELKNEENSWESQFKADFTRDHPIRLKRWTDEQCEKVIETLCFGLQEYTRKCGFKSFTVALSGGMDSGLVLTLAKLALAPDQSLEAIYMPSQYSADLSLELSQKLCDQLEVPLNILPINELHDHMREHFNRFLQNPLQGLADENIQSRLRGSLLYARSNQVGSMVINTSNKSELAVGYSTLYGDSVGALSLLGDLYKSEVYDLAHYIHRTRNLIPIGFMDRAPSAELRENQEDAQSLPPYEILDTILEGLLSYRHSVKELIELGLPEQDVKKVYGLYTKSEYKRNQFCPIIKVKAKSFGFGYRVPITKKI
ncbi:MAG: hypothetical protein CME60_11195 [Halobacteriovoraceae bacterium]|nr:hypothetical protein [Halobacteriovoraceae bacterium]